ncbi:winged helix-turn-helix transcriptional regulator [Streptomyces sp. CA-253872]|uniref:winged helix-turn-helix transcriptional regulator n=1 Tax=Streptomyces sp. CA-253872 TaxID=3240067 RepID=UPI003D91A4C1
MTSPLEADMFDPRCPGIGTPLRGGGKWTVMVLLCLAEGPRRFGEMRVPLRRVTAKVLAETLRAMERDGLVTRTAYEENPPHVSYALTPLGRSLLPLVAHVREWTLAHLRDLDAARSAYDGNEAVHGDLGGPGVP